jgi:hypothetical protein
VIGILDRPEPAPDFRFYVGLHHPADARLFDRAFVSANAIRTRKSGFPANRWIMDSGAFTEVSTYGGYRHCVADYAGLIRRFARVGTLECAVAQDFMCEPEILGITGLTIPCHQRLTIERYDELVALDTGGVPIMPVLQGYAPSDYVRHVKAYGKRLAPGARVGVGSVCQRQGNPKAIVQVLDEIHAERPDLRLHGFGVKLTALKSPRVRRRLHSADSMAWSAAARYEGGDANASEEACFFERTILDWTGSPYGEHTLIREDAEWRAIVAAATNGEPLPLPPAFARRR